MPRTTSIKKTSGDHEKSNNGSKTSEMNKKSTGDNKKQDAVNVKVPTAREKSKGFDEGRRNDANSNEL